VLILIPTLKHQLAQDSPILYTTWHFYSFKPKGSPIGKVECSITSAKWFGDRKHIKVNLTLPHPNLRVLAIKL
jgi:hypothetical protein